MSPFVIFTITLIVVYLVYYSLLITRDLYGKKGSNRGDEEEFEISALQEEEEAIGVQESENGFLLVPRKDQTKVSDSQDYASEISTVADRINLGKSEQLVSQSNSEHQDKQVNRSDVNQSKGDEKPTSGEESIQKKIDKVQEEMDVIDPIGSLTMSKEFFREILLDANKEGSLFIKKTQVSAT